MDIQPLFRSVPSDGPLAVRESLRPVRVTEEGTVGAPPERVYAVLADYRNHHRRILPPAFRRLSVEAGGVGAGTLIAVELALGGRIHAFRARVEEPEPGRVLKETDVESGAATTFTVRPDGAGARVRIETIFTPPPGLRGLFERRVAAFLLRRLYREELARLNAYAQPAPGSG